jgi:hypothetical protein
VLGPVPAHAFVDMCVQMFYTHTHPHTHVLTHARTSMHICTKHLEAFLHTALYPTGGQYKLKKNQVRTKHLEAFLHTALYPTGRQYKLKKNQVRTKHFEAFLHTALYLLHLLHTAQRIRQHLHRTRVSISKDAVSVFVQSNI